MKMMLKNEKNANSALNQRLHEMNKELHSENFTVRQYEEKNIQLHLPHKA